MTDDLKYCHCGGIPFVVEESDGSWVECPWCASTTSQVHWGEFESTSRTKEEAITMIHEEWNKRQEAKS